MVAETIEGEVIEHGLTVIEPQQVARLASSQTPEDMIGLASRMASALKDIVERQRLYAVIQGKKFPQVEAWMTIGRMDNVVARESEHPIRRDDGSYEAFVELVRLSDGMVVGSASALCGTPDDKPWNGRSEPARRSMAVTRATSRAFRQQYSWIMALAGYEPTPAEEMPRDREEQQQEAKAGPIDPKVPVSLGRWEGEGRVEFGTAQTSDGQVRESPEVGPFVGFKLGGAGIAQAIAEGPLAVQLVEMSGGAIANIRNVPVKVAGALWRITGEKDGRTYTYKRLILERLETPLWAVPAPAGATESAPAPADEPEGDGLGDLPGWQ